MAASPTGKTYIKGAVVNKKTEVTERRDNMA
jgi:hypothetical protein